MGEGKRLRSEASCVVPSGAELCSATGTRASDYEAKLRAQSRAAPSCARRLERGQAITKRSFVRSRNDAELRLAAGPHQNCCAVLTPPKGGVIQSTAPDFTPPSRGVNQSTAPDITPPSRGVNQSTALYFTPPSGGVRFAERIWWGWGLQLLRTIPESQRGQIIEFAELAAADFGVFPKGLQVRLEVVVAEVGSE